MIGQYRNSYTTVMGLAVAIMIVGVVPCFSQVVGQGSFLGQSNHVTSGAVELHRSGDDYVIVLGSDFRFDGAPDPKIGLGNGGVYDPSTTMSGLNSNTGEQSYRVPGSIDVSSYDEVYVWCEQYKVPLGVARVR